MASNTIDLTSARAQQRGIALGGADVFRVRKVSPDCIADALRRGFDDFWAKPSHILFLGVVYPLAGLFLGNLAIGYDIVPLLFPLFAGLSLVGPFVAIGLYEISRRREQGLDSSWYHALEVIRAPGKAAILELGFLLMVIYLAWLACAMTVYHFTLGATPHDSMTDFLEQVLTTPQGWALIVLGNGIGFLFAVAVLITSVVSFPLILDQHVSAGTAIRTSVAAVRTNPETMLLWGLVVAIGLVLGCLTLLVGLALIVPILGHATWHLYRKVVETGAAE